MSIHDLTWDDMLGLLFLSILDGQADEVDLSAVRNWPDQDSSETPLDYYGDIVDDWPAWAGVE